MKPINIGILGLGTVGGGTATVLQRNAEEIERRAGRAICLLSASVRDLSKKRNVNLSNVELTEDSHAIVDNPAIDIIIELIGGTELARQLVLKAIANGKHVAVSYTH